MKALAALLLFTFSFLAVGYAQDAAALPATGLMGWIAAHGGLQLSVLMLVGCFNIACSAIREILAKLDGVDLSKDIPAGEKSLTLLNKLALWSGKILDYVGNNVQHK